MSKFGLKFHHLGLAVRSPDAAISFAVGQGYRVGRSTYDPAQNVNLILCEHETEPSIEIVYPADGKSPLDKYLAHKTKGIVYHACYSSEDLQRTLDNLSNAELRPICISPPKPAVLFGGANVSFYNLMGVGLIEIIETAPT